MELMEKIKRMIQANVEGSCPPRGELERFYHNQLVDQVPFEHVLCCETCLDVVNDILGLPRLEDRGPFDALTRQRSTHRSDPPSRGMGGGDQELPSDHVSAEPPVDEISEEDEEPVEKPTISFQRVRQAVAQVYEARPERLIVCVNGRPCASQPVGQASQTIILWPDEEPEFIEVLSEAGIRLAYMDVDRQRLEAAPEHGRVTLSGGREIELHVSFDQASGVTVQVAYRDPSAEAAAAAKEKTRWAWLASLFDWRPGRLPRWKVPALATVAAVLLLSIASIFLYSFIKTRGELESLTQEREQLRQQIDQLAEDLEKAKQQSSQPGGQNAVGFPSPERSVPGSKDNLVAPENEIAQLEPTRSRKTRAGVKSLLAVKRVYVPSLGDDPFNQQVHNSLISRLQASGKFIITEHPGEADAALKGFHRREQMEVRQLVFQLVNAKGDVLWRTTHEDSGESAVTEIAAQVVKDLLDEIKRLERNRERPKKP
jgi:hypothetical protein